MWPGKRVQRASTRSPPSVRLAQLTSSSPPVGTNQSITSAIVRGARTACVPPRQSWSRLPRPLKGLAGGRSRRGARCCFSGRLPCASGFRLDVILHVLPILPCTTAIPWAGDGGSAPSPLPRRARGAADHAAHRAVSPREHTGPRSSDAEAFLRNNYYYYGQQLGSEESFARRIQRELLYQTAVILTPDRSFS